MHILNVIYHIKFFNIQHHVVCQLDVYILMVYIILNVNIQHVVYQLNVHILMLCIILNINIQHGILV